MRQAHPVFILNRDSFSGLPDSPEDAVVEEDEGGHGAEPGGEEARPVDVVADVVRVVAQVSHAVSHLPGEDSGSYYLLLDIFKNHNFYLR